MNFYIGIVHKDENSDFGISFPDFPGCVSAGSTMSEVLAMGREALEGHIGVLADDGEAIPEPSAVEAILANPDFSDGIAVLVPAPAPASSRVMRVNITVPEDALREIDHYAEANGLTRSGLLVRAARQFVQAA